MSITDFVANATNTNGNINNNVENPIPAGSLLKDLGRQITVYDSAQVGYPHVAIFRQVLYINQTASTETEGIGNQVIFYVCTWSQVSGGTPFYTSSVVRTG
jgi:hypothetical protein